MFCRSLAAGHSKDTKKFQIFTLRARTTSSSNDLRSLTLRSASAAWSGSSSPSSAALRMRSASCSLTKELYSAISSLNSFTLSVLEMQACNSDKVTLHPFSRMRAACLKNSFLMHTNSSLLKGCALSLKNLAPAFNNHRVIRRWPFLTEAINKGSKVSATLSSGKCDGRVGLARSSWLAELHSSRLSRSTSILIRPCAAHIVARSESASMGFTRFLLRRN
mmetsp:Transcript_22055/g.43828  ORF Transcript_22055/g.43828 Transcript_22055/m.43828 type:complete len:220 (+) Transcript_22055:1113-1772(+)